jgi:hypothetical protein
MEALTRSWDGTPREQAFVWLLQKGRSRARCALWSHPLGWELRVTINGELLRSQAYREADDVLSDVADWRQQFAAKGWK